MGQRQSRREKAEGGECVHGVNPGTLLTLTDHKAEVHPRYDETHVCVGEGGGRERQKKGRDEKKKRKNKRFRRFASFFCCMFRPKSTRAQDEQVEQGEVDQDTDEAPSRRFTDDQTSLQDVICSVEDNDHQEPPASAPEVLPAAEDQPQDQDSPVSPSADESAPHLPRQLDCDEIVRVEDHICWKYIIGKKMGEGTYSSVYEGTRCEDGLQVAVKFTAKVENESYIRLPDHPRPVPLEVALTVLANQGTSCRHIIELLDWQDHLDQYIMVLEQPSPCMDMHDFWLHYDGLFSEGMARHFMQQVIDAAAVCCSRGVLHRDIKMPNLLVNIETLEVKLIDFGCGDLLKSTLYKTYSGTSRYCPPEYFERGEYNGKQATVWSLGVLLFRMITSLFPESSDISLMDTDIWSQPGFSNECCRFIRGCLKSDPGKRLHLEEMLFHDWFKSFTELPVKPVPQIPGTAAIEVPVTHMATELFLSHLGPNDPVRAAAEILVNATVTASPKPAEVRENRIKGTAEVTRHGTLSELPWSHSFLSRLEGFCCCNPRACNGFRALSHNS
ncbi:CBL-interacting protein kinase 18-like [Sinocyclocheilus anshuiensis]|uniref:CBL-interacting protein kinase 18-like n=1 Tax=Sinocyclocheilus anshuiensis TaxID=1608454 RepID=UPI0007B7EFF7|nr:PREDICTED: CBL-interacting protein kinase 18-like [Sinocyclocheilus anshuiensis]